MSDPRPVKRRRRPALSCTQCRQRKVRCDREYPCAPCMRARQAVPCSYDPEYRAKDTRSSFVNVQNTSTCSSAYSGESMGGEAPNYRPTRSRPALEQTVDDLQCRIQKLEQLVLVNRKSMVSLGLQSDELNELAPELTNGASTIEQQPGSSHGEPDRQYASIQLPTSQLNITSAKSKFATPGHCTHAFQQLHLLNGFKRSRGTTMDDRQAAEMKEEFKKCKSFRAMLKSRYTAVPAEPFPNLINDLPSNPDDCTEMVSSYFENLAYLYGILGWAHRPDIGPLYGTQRGNIPHSTLLKTLLLVGIGSALHSNPHKRYQVSLQVRRWAYAAQWWLTGPSEKSAHNLQGLEVFCLMILCRQVHSIDKESIWISVGALVRFACSLGLHQDPKHFPTLSPTEFHRRRCLWQAVMELAIQSSFDVAMPPLISEDDFDTEPPLNIPAREIERDPQTMPSSRPDNQNTSAWALRFLMRTLPTRLQAARLLSKAQSSQSYERALELGSELNSFCKQLADCSRLPNFPTPGSLTYDFLDALLHRTILLLYRPFAIQGIHNPVFHLARKLSFESGVKMASYAHEHTHSQQQSPTCYTQLCVSGIGIFKGPFSIDVILAICLELITRLEEETKTATQNHDGILPPRNKRFNEHWSQHYIHLLEHIQEQLFCIISSGLPSMKRYAILCAALAQIKELQRTGTCSKEVIYGTLLECVRKCSHALEICIGSTSGSGLTPGYNGVEWSSAELTPLTSDFEFDLLVCFRWPLDMLRGRF